MKSIKDLIEEQLAKPAIVELKKSQMTIGGLIAIQLGDDSHYWKNEIKNCENEIEHLNSINDHSDERIGERILDLYENIEYAQKHLK